MTQNSTPRDIAEIFQSHGYNTAGLENILGSLRAPSSHARNIQLLLARTPPDDPLRVLIRLFFLNVPVARSQVIKTLGEAAIARLQKHALLTMQDDTLASQTHIYPYRERLICSHPERHLAEQSDDHVLTVSPAANHLCNFTLREPVNSALDLACGGGVQALFLADHCEQVVASDLNTRAVEFGRFNAALNGIDNIDWRSGDMLTPVSGMHFEQIVCNPPFVLTPDRRYLYRDNPEELDLLCQRIVREAPVHLQEGGILQMILEWVELDDEPWQNRLAGWFQDCGCDVWVFQQYRQTPDLYAHNRLREMPPSSEQEDADTFQRWMDYYRHHRVAAMHSGLIAMRRRQGDNWLELEEHFDSPREPFGDLVSERFRNRDFLHVENWQAALLASRPRLAGHARLVHECVPEDGEWRTLSIRLSSSRDNLPPVGLDGTVGQFLGGLDGSRTLAEHLQELLARVNADPAIVTADCCRTLRFLLLRGLCLVD